MNINDIQNSKTTEKIYKTKSLFFAINKLAKPLGRLIREGGKKDTCYQYQDERGNITTDSTAKEIKGVLEATLCQYK